MRIEKYFFHLIEIKSLLDNFGNSFISKKDLNSEVNKNIQTNEIIKKISENPEIKKHQRCVPLEIYTKVYKDKF